MIRVSLRLPLLVAIVIQMPMSPIAAEVLTLNRAVEMAMKHNQDYLIAKTQLDKADAEVTRAMAGALPKLDFSSNYTRNFQISTAVFAGQTFKLGTDNSVDIGGSLTQPLWLGGKVFTAMKIARIYKKYSYELVRETESQIVFGVRRAFLSAMLAKDFVGVFKDALATTEWNLDMVSKMRSQGVISEYELLRAEVEAANLRPQLTQSQNQAIIAEDNLKNLIGYSLDAPVDLEYAFDSTMVGQSLELENLQKIAMANRASLRSQDYLQDITKRAIKIAKAGNSFTLEFQTRYNWRYQADDLGFKSDNWSPSWNAMINFKLPLFDGFQTSADVKKAKADYYQNQMGYEKLKEQVELDVRQAFYNYQETSERLKARVKTNEQAQEGLRIARLRYQNGVGTQLEILSAEAALTQSKTNYVQATHDAAEAVFQLIRVTGVDTFDQLKER